jgi:hypothetical protein
MDTVKEPAKLTSTLALVTAHYADGHYENDCLPSSLVNLIAEAAGLGATGGDLYRAVYTGLETRLPAEPCNRRVARVLARFVRKTAYLKYHCPAGFAC